MTELGRTFAEFGDALQNTLEWMVETIRAAVEMISKTELQEIIAGEYDMTELAVKTCSNGKVKHLATHAKKGRVRKKNRARALRMMRR